MATPDTTRTQRRVCQRSRRTAAAAALVGVAAIALAVTGNAFAGGSNPLSDSSAGLPDVAAAAAKAAPVAENGVAGVTGAATQPGAPDVGSSGQPTSAGGLSSIDAATQQAATAIADATQNNVQNVVIVVRINSPGDDVISQTNTAAAVAVPTNTSTTQQGTGAAAPGDQADPSASSPDATATPADGTSGGGTPAAGSPPAPSPAQVEPPATTPAVTPLRVLTAAPERVRPRIAVPPPASSDRVGAAHRRAPAPEPAAATVRTASKPEQSASQPKVAPRQTTHAAPGPVSVSSPRTSWLSVTSAPTRIGKAAATRVGAGAAHLVSRLAAPTGTLPSNKGDSISTAVLVALLAVALAVLLGSHPAVRLRAWR